jgi:DNA-binding Xre family transcriptional regulator
MKKGEICKKAGISTISLEALAKGKNVTVDILVKVCDALDCKIDDIMDILPKKEIADGDTN